MTQEHKTQDKTIELDKIKKIFTQQCNPMSDYQAEFEKFCNDHRVRISTGYNNIDRLLDGGLINELYILAAETSTGKSAFMMSIAQHLAENGIDVLYFSLEMGRMEFVARGISSISFYKDSLDKNGRRFTAGNILNWTFDNRAKKFTRIPFSSYKEYSDMYFQKYGQHLHIIEAGINGLTVNDIANTAALYKKRLEGKPLVVFVDYLQIICADKDDRSQADRKTKTDNSVRVLKSLASQVGMPVFTVSSVSKQKYGEGVMVGSFKESGDIDYTGGVLFGWDWLGVTDEKNQNSRQKAVQNSKERGYRNMRLSILKNRNSERDVSCLFEYYPAYNYFKECPTSNNDNQKSENKAINVC